MTLETQAREKLKKAYRVLNTPQTASALSIKANYHKLIKRWHPDKPATNAATPSEAMMMTKLINEAYSLIENAPLRYYTGGETQVRTGAKEYPRARERRGVESLSDAQIALIEKRTEYAVRILCGVLSGALIGVLLMDLMRSSRELVGATTVCAIAFAAGAVRLGDKLWREVFGIWWKWQ
jgi:hypothetical protein